MSDQNPASADVRVVLLGYGLAGAVFHAPLIAATPGLRLAAVVTSDPGRAQQVRRDHPGVRVLAQRDEAWRDSGAFDLAVIATPNRSHATLAAEALHAGLAVVVDKPLALDAAQADALCAIVPSRGAGLTVFHNRRWDGDFLTLRALLDAGALGTVQRFESRFERWRPQPRPGWRMSGAADDGGGVLYDLGSHLVDQALQLFGPVRRVYAELQRRHPQAQVDDDSFVALEHDGGTLSHLWMSSMAADAGPRLRVLGSDAAYVKHGLDPQEDALRHGARPPAPDWGHEPEAHWGERVSGERRERIATRAGDYPAFYAGVRRWIRDGAPPPVDPRDAIATLRVIEAVQRAARERRSVTLD